MSDKPFHITYSTLEHSQRDGQIRAFIVNTDRLPEGDHVGAWHPFPCTADEMAATLKEIGIDGEKYINFTIENFSAKVPRLAACLPPDSDLNELNYLAAKLDGMTEDNREIVAAVLETHEYTDTLWDLLNIIENLECYTLNPAIVNIQSLGLLTFETERDLANTAIGALEASTYEDADTLLRYIEMLEPHFNAEHYGEALHMDGDGLFTEFGYLEKTSREFETIHLGNEQIPAEFRVHEYSFQSQAEKNTPTPEKGVGRSSLRENLKKKGEQAKAQASPDTHPKPRAPER